MFKKTLTLSAMMLAANSYAGEADVRAHVQEVVGYLQAIEAAGINNPKTVGPDGCDFTTIQEAIDSGADQVRIVAKDTPYFENVHIQNKQVALKGNYANCSDAGSDVESDVKAVIDGGQSGFVVGLEGQTLNTLSHLVIQNGTEGGVLTLVEFLLMENLYVKNNSNVSGGGVDVLSGGLYIKDSTVESNSALIFGGGIGLDEGKVLISGQSSIIENSSQFDDGGIVIQGTNSSLTIFSPVVISGNNAVHNAGGISAYGSTLNLYGKRMCEQGHCFGINHVPVNILNNTADSDGDGDGNGGGLYADQSQLGVYNALFQGNVAYLGGAVYSRDHMDDSDIQASHFEQNRADFGAVATFTGSANDESDYISFQDSVITNNGDNGSGDYGDYTLFYVDTRSTLDLIHNTIADNHVVENVINNNGQQVTTSLSSNIVDEDVPLYFGGAGSSLVLDCLLISNADGLDAAPFIEVADPSFEDAESGNYRLKPDSPAIDFCDQGFAGIRDKDGVKRGYDDPAVVNRFGTYDLGAYELSDVIFEDGFE